MCAQREVKVGGYTATRPTRMAASRASRGFQPCTTPYTVAGHRYTRTTRRVLTRKFEEFMRRTTEEILEDVRSRGSDVATAGQDGIRIEYRNRLPASLVDEIGDRRHELRQHLDDRYYEKLAAQASAEAEASLVGGHQLVDIRRDLKANVHEMADEAILEKAMKTFTRELARAKKGRDPSQVEYLLGRIAVVEEARARMIRRNECRSAARQAVMEKLSASHRR